MKIITIPIISILALSISACSLFSDIKEPEYKLVESFNYKDVQIEVRNYAPSIVAEVSTEGERSESANKAFRILFDYISGNNSKSQKIAMTAPVMQTDSSNIESQKIPMTAPVKQSKNPDGTWKTAFYLPSEFTLANTPNPKDKRVLIRQILATNNIAVVKFSGRWTDENMMENKQKLMSFLNENNYQIIGKPSYAFYNDPFTPWFMRRNEVMVKVFKD